MTDFRDLVEPDDLSTQEELRLRRVHELLVQAGPPPDLPPALLEPPTRPAVADVAEFPLPPSKRRGALILIAAALALAVFGGGYLFGHAKAKPATFAVAHVVPMHGNAAAAVLTISHRDAAGNWPMQMQVHGLPRQGNRDAVLRALADTERTADPGLRPVPRPRQDDARHVQRPLVFEGRRRLGGHLAAAGAAAPRPDRAPHLTRPLTHRGASPRGRGRAARAASPLR